MAYIISLRPNHVKQMQVQHVLLDDAKTYTPKEIYLLAAAAKEDDTLRKSLAIALRSCLRNVVGRYLYYWPVSRPHADDMVSEGFCVISDFILDIDVSHDILKVVSRRIQDRINNYLNKMQGLASPSLRQQKYLKSQGSDPIHMLASLNEYDEDLHPQDGGDEWKRDALDAIAHIEPEDELDRELLSRFNWGRGYQELADELGVGVGTIHRRKARLYKKFQELMR